MKKKQFLLLSALMVFYISSCAPTTPTTMDIEPQESPQPTETTLIEPVITEQPTPTPEPEIRPLLISVAENPSVFNQWVIKQL